MLQLSHYGVAYGQSKVISDMNFTLQEREIVAVVGRNGMGKSTLMKSLIGMIPSQAGDIVLHGKSIKQLKSYERVKSGLAFVPQGRMIFSTMTVKENILAALPAGRSKIPEELYDLFPVLKTMQHRRGGNLSGGQQQQLAIARALATEPSVLILDEPTEGIQPSIIKEMARTLRTIRDLKGLAIIVSEQVLSFALDVADRVCVMEKGKLVRDESRANVDAAAVASFLAV